MTTTSLHAEPTLRAVVEEQLCTVGKVLKPFLAALVAMWFLFDAVMMGLAEQAVGLHEHGLPFRAVNLHFSPEVSIVAAIPALLLSLITWLDEGPSRRTYLLMMPVGRTAHMFAKVLAGWFWTMIATAGFLANTLLIDFVAVRLQPFVAGVHLSPSPLWYYLVPFTVATVAYVFGSAAAVGSRVPVIWVTAPPLLLIGLVAFAEEYRISWMKQLRVALDGTYGLLRALGYSTSNAYDYAGKLLVNGLGAWSGATVLWCAIAIAALLYASKVRREVR